MGDHRVSQPLLLLAATLALALGGCAGNRTLETKSAAVPAGIDFSGHWRLRADSRDSEQRIAEAGVEAAGGPASIIPPQRKRSSKSSKRKDGSLVHVFLYTGKNLKITQTDYGLFISFDRAVVEEYRFGENREVQVGEAVAQRASGWEADAYLIETLDDDDALMTEIYRLTNGGDALQRRIMIEQGKDIRLDVSQTFDRN